MCYLADSFEVDELFRDSPAAAAAGIVIELKENEFDELTQLLSPLV